jgi:hypothetical protein
MIAALIFVVSIAAFIQFFVFYSRSVIAASRKHALSENVREVTGISGEMVEDLQFDRLLQLVELCPGSGSDEMGIRAVRAYFSGLGMLLSLVPQAPSGILSRTASWLKRERGACAYFAATALDQRMAYSRTLLSHGARS